MSDDFRPGPEFRRKVDQRSRQLRRRRQFLATLGAVAASALAIGLSLALTGSGKTATIKVLTPSTILSPTTTASPTSTSLTPGTTSAGVTTTSPTAPTSTTTAGPRTQVITYDPFVGNHLDPSLHVTATYTAASCYPYRVLSVAHAYYRCFAQSPGGVYDPCFAGPRGTSGPLVCPGDPTTDRVVLLNVTSVTTMQPTSTQTGGTGRPWAFQLSTGPTCEFVAAAWGGLGPYGCNTYSSDTRPADCRQPTTSTLLWTTDCQDQMTNASPFTRVTVVKAWF